MTQTAKIFNNGRSQAVRLPASCRFEGTEVYVRQDPETGDVILSKKPSDWKGFFEALDHTDVPDDFLTEKDRRQGTQNRDPFDGWKE